MAEGTFTLPQLADLVGVEYRTLHTWLRRGLLAPSRAKARGSGSRNLFDREDALEAFVLADLRRAGVELPTLERVSAALRAARPGRGEGGVLLVNGSVSFCTDEACLHEALGHSSPTLVYDVAHAHTALSGRWPEPE
jgi:DNA-binding transcriptional MerR regulator